jgi:hypothetical protein
MADGLVDIGEVDVVVAECICTDGEIGGAELDETLLGRVVGAGSADVDVNYITGIRAGVAA